MTIPDLNLASINKQLDSTLEALAKADAELKWELAGSAADIAGLVDPTPASDLVGAGLSLRKGDFIGAALSTVSMVPYVGDAVAKPAKAVRATKAIVALEKKTAKLTKEANDLRKLKKEAEAAEELAKKQAQSGKGAGSNTIEPPAAAKGKEKGKGKDCEDCSTSPKKPPSKNDEADLAVHKVSAPIDFDGHILAAEVKSNGKVVGGHSTAAGNVKIIPGTASAPNAHGVYKAKIEVPDPNNPGSFLAKTNNGGYSTMFPDSWSANRIKVEVDAAYQNRTVIGQKWTGTTPSGVTVEGFLQPKTTVYPIY